jgi:phosphoribulokinase
MFEGLHPFYLKSQADLYDLKVFIKPDERIRIHRKLKRDVGERGKTTEGVLQQLKDREGDSEKYIQGQQQFADIVFSFVPVGDDLDKEALEITLSNDIPLDDLVIELSANGELDITHEFIADNKQWIKLNGSISQEAIELIAYELLPELEELGIYEPQWQSNYNGIIQLLLAKCIFDNLK